MVVAAKVSIFSEINALSADFFIFHSKREAIAHGDWQLSPFFRSGPRIVASKGGNLGRFLQKFHGLPPENLDKKPTLEVFGRKTSEAPASAAPTALRSRGNCLFI